MSGNVIDLTTKTFDDFIKSGNSVVDFWATWCGPCRMMEPEYESAAKAMKGKVKFGKVNVDEEEELAQRFQIMSIPTTIFFKGKENVHRISGARHRDDLLDEIKNTF